MSHIPKLNEYYYCNEWLKLQCGCPDWTKVLDVKRVSSALEHIITALAKKTIIIWQKI